MTHRVGLIKGQEVKNLETGKTQESYQAYAGVEDLRLCRVNQMEVNSL